MVKSSPLIIISIIVIADRLAKSFAEHYNSIMLTNSIGLQLAHNTGALWSLGTGFNFIFIAISIIVLGFFIKYWKTLTATQWTSIMASLILAGLIGNLWDRLATGYVIDFIKIGWWPNFNIADSSLVTGVIGLIIKHDKIKL